MKLLAIDNIIKTAVFLAKITLEQSTKPYESIFVRKAIKDFCLAVMNLPMDIEK